MVVRVQMTKVNYDGGLIYGPNAVVDMEDNKAAYLLGMGAVTASAAATSTAPTPPTRVDNRPSSLKNTGARP